VNVSQATEVSRNGYAVYATSADFCRIFSEKMDRLYLLALLLTADAGKAEQCFVAGIGDSVKGNRVFREWAYSWARRTVIQQAIRIIEPARDRLAIADTMEVGLEMEPRLRAILKLDALERFVFVMSVLEGYSYQDCSILLGCSRPAVMNARARALEHLANGPDIVVMLAGKLQDAYAPVSH
jgi:DNA-directed RNA polymerase specialized sigma24 family protein